MQWQGLSNLTSHVYLYCVKCDSINNIGMDELISYIKYVACWLEYNIWFVQWKLYSSKSRISQNRGLFTVHNDALWGPWIHMYIKLNRKLSTNVIEEVKALRTRYWLCWRFALRLLPTTLARREKIVRGILQFVLHYLFILV